ncbi:MAG: DUF4249 domain-containing protein [Chitinophagaceae bacterium]|nr:MAG: DUF4249 domain-containing protein [Chitinophagaceae bacterium]
MFYACSTEIDLNLPDPEPRIVVEGYIENGRQPFVLLTRNAPYYGDLDLNDLDSYLVRNAVVKVKSEGVEEILPEICLSTLPPALREELLIELGVSPKNFDVNNFEICVYISLNPQIIGETGKTYELYVLAGDEELTASTHIPDLLTLDSLWYVKNTEGDNDSLYTVFMEYTDPDTIGNYIRYSSKRNSEPFYGVWAIDDRLINGQTVVLPLRRGQGRFDEFDIETFGYYFKGDTAIIRWASIDKAHFDFWNTMEFEMVPSGPFGTPTEIMSNINGGLGIWGGYAAYYDTLYILGN